MVISNDKGIVIDLSSAYINGGEICYYDKPQTLKPSDKNESTPEL